MQMPFRYLRYMDGGRAQQHQSPPQVTSCGSNLIQVLTPHLWGRSWTEATSSRLEQSLGQILEAAVSVGSRALEVQLDALLVTLHAQVGWAMTTLRILWGWTLQSEHDLE